MTCNQEKRKERKDTEEVKAIKCRKVNCLVLPVKGNKNFDKNYLPGKNLSCFRGDKQKAPIWAFCRRIFHTLIGERTLMFLLLVVSSS